MQLLKTFKTEGKHVDVYPSQSWQYVYQDGAGFLRLRGRHTGWDFTISALPGVDFAWSYNEDPRTNEELVFARDRWARG